MIEIAIRLWCCVAVMSLCMIGSFATAQPRPEYAVGQVWEYQTRPEDQGSLVRIQKIENLPALAAQGPVYHISIIGVHFAHAPLAGSLQHLPVSRATLDASLTRLSSSTAAFPDASAGIDQWHAAHGGVFTIPLAQIVDVAEKMVVGRTP